MEEEYSVSIVGAEGVRVATRSAGCTADGLERHCVVLVIDFGSVALVCTWSTKMIPMNGSMLRREHDIR